MIYGLVRHVSHTAIKQVAAYLAGQRPPKHLDPIVDRLRTNASLSSVAGTFVELQEQREDADYNHLADLRGRGASHSSPERRRPSTKLISVPNPTTPEQFSA